MVRRVGTMMVVLGSLLLVASYAGAFSMGEVTATTGMQGTLARSGTSNPAGTIGTVQRAIGAAAATKQGQLAAAGGGMSWGGKGGGTGGWATANGSGWATASTGWASTGTTGWASGKGGSAWQSGPWGTAIASR
jgi:hypothetical protein